MTLLDALGSGYGSLSYPGGHRQLAGCALDSGKLVISESEIDGVRSSVTAGGPTARSFVFHETYITVKQKSLARWHLMLYDKDMNTTQGQALAATLRKSFHVGPRTRDRRDGESLKTQFVESIVNAIQYPGYYNETRTELSRAAFGAVDSYYKHVVAGRCNPLVRLAIMQMSPYRFLDLLAEMVDAGVTNTGQGEDFFREMNQKRMAAA